MTLIIPMSDVISRKGFSPSSCFEWFEAARTSYMRERGLPYSNLEKSGVHLPVIYSTVKRLNFLDIKSDIHVKIKSAFIRGIRINFDYEVFLSNNGYLYAKGSTVHVPIDLDGKVLKISEKLRRLFD